MGEYYSHEGRLSAGFCGTGQAWGAVDAKPIQYHGCLRMGNSIERLASAAVEF